MRERMYTGLSEVLADLLQTSPNRQLGSVFLLLLFALVLNIAASALFEMLQIPPLLAASFLPLLLLVAFLTRVFRSRKHVTHDSALETRLPGRYPGLILMLGLFNSRGATSPQGFADKDWRRPELEKAIEGAAKWPTIIERFTNSNMAPALEAIRHHSKDGTLRHVWLISTDDVCDGEGRVKQEGSRRLAPLFCKVVKEGMGFDVTVHHDDPRLRVAPYDVEAVYNAVVHICQVAAPQVGIDGKDVIADLTGGRVPMTGGMILACSPRGWPMQYTSTDLDPALHAFTVTPVPVEISVNVREIQRCALEAVQRQISAGSSG